MSANQTPSGELAQRLADRLCHDILGSTQAFATGLDLLREAPDPEARDEATAILAEALAAQKAKLEFARRAFGHAGGEADTAELRAVCEALYADLRPSLEWRVNTPAMGPIAARALLNLVQIAAEGLAVGGIARVDARGERGGTAIVVTALGARVSLREEARAGMAGEPFGVGLSGRWVQGAFVSALVSAAGGALSVEAREGAITFSVILPPDD